jgi:hypothetical protein
MPADRQDRTELDHHLERFRILSVKIQPLARENQVAGARDRQELGEPFHDSEQYGFQVQRKIHGNPSVLPESRLL